MSKSNLTPYAAAQVASRVLKREIAPQTMYGLARPNKSTNESRIATVPDSKPIMFVGDEFQKWLDAAKSNSGAARVRQDYDKLAKEFSADVEDDEDENDEVDETDEAETFEEVANKADMSALEGEDDEESDDSDDETELEKALQDSLDEQTEKAEQA